MSVVSFPGAQPVSKPRDGWWGIKYKQLGEIDDLEELTRTVVLLHVSVDICLQEFPDKGSTYAVHPRPSTHDTGAIVRVYDVYTAAGDTLAYKATVHIRPDYKWIVDRINAIIHSGALEIEDEPEKYKGLAMVFDKRVHPSPKFKDVFSMRVSGNLYE